MKRWWVVGLLVLCAGVIGSGAFYWQQQTNEEAWASTVTETIDNHEKQSELADPTTKTKAKTVEIEEKEREKNDEMGSSLPLWDIIAPYEEKFDRLTRKYEEDLSTYLASAEEEYQTKVRTGMMTHKELVDAYTDKADDLEGELDKRFNQYMTAVSEKLTKEGYDDTYTWEAEWQYETKKEQARLSFVRRLISLRTFD